MPSKKVRAKSKKVTAGMMYRGLPKLKPIQDKYMGHAFRISKMNRENTPEDILRMLIDVELAPVDKEYMDTIKKYIDESEKIQNIVQAKKKPLNFMTRKIIRERIHRVLEFSEMSALYKRQQMINKAMSGIYLNQ